MTEVVEVRNLEDCLDGTIVREFLLDGSLDRETMRRLAAGGTLAFYESFPRPYFRIDLLGAVIQGVIGCGSFRATLPAASERSLLGEVERRVSGRSR